MNLFKYLNLWILNKFNAFYKKEFQLYMHKEKINLLPVMNGPSTDLSMLICWIFTGEYWILQSFNLSWNLLSFNSVLDNMFISCFGAVLMRDSLVSIGFRSWLSLKLSSLFVPSRIASEFSFAFFGECLLLLKHSIKPNKTNTAYLSLLLWIFLLMTSWNSISEVFRELESYYFCCFG